MSPIEQATFLIQNPAELGRALGYVDFRDDLHGHWIYRLVKATEDMTLQAHRGSYKTTCLCVAIAQLMVWQPEKNIIFLRKTDSDVGEVIILRSPAAIASATSCICMARCGTATSIPCWTPSLRTVNAYDVPRSIWSRTPTRVLSPRRSCGRAGRSGPTTSRKTSISRFPPSCASGGPTSFGWREPATIISTRSWTMAEHNEAADEAEHAYCDLTRDDEVFELITD